MDGPSWCSVATATCVHKRLPINNVYFMLGRIVYKHPINKPKNKRISRVTSIKPKRQGGVRLRKLAPCLPPKELEKIVPKSTRELTLRRTP